MTNKKAVIVFLSATAVYIFSHISLLFTLQLHMGLWLDLFMLCFIIWFFCFSRYKDAISPKFNMQLSIGVLILFVLAVLGTYIGFSVFLPSPATAGFAEAPNPILFMLGVIILEMIVFTQLVKVSIVVSVIYLLKDLNKKNLLSLFIACSPIIIFFFLVANLI